MVRSAGVLMGVQSVLQKCTARGSCGLCLRLRTSALPVSQLAIQTVIVILSEAKDLLCCQCVRQQVLLFAQDDKFALYYSELTGCGANPAPAPSSNLPLRPRPHWPAPVARGHRLCRTRAPTRPRKNHAPFRSALASATTTDPDRQVGPA